jgi:anti-sigma-K factor RskA
VTQHPTEDLGLYALGLLEPAERRTIAQHLATCAACRADLASHESTVAALAPEPAVPRATDLRRRVVARYDNAWTGRRPVFAYAASAVLAVALVIAGVSLSQERAMRDDYGRALAAVANGARVVTLQAKADTTTRGAIVVSRDGEAYLVLQLPSPPAGKAYEAWVIRGGVPMPAGMAPALGGVVTMQLHEVLRAGDSAAITLEDSAGAQAPTTVPLLIGDV